MSEVVKNFSADEIGWVIDCIAEHNFRPAEPGKPWPGESGVLLYTKQKFTLDDAQAKQLIDLAVAQLWSPEPDPPVRMERRLALSRLDQLSDLIWRELRTPKKEVFYEVKTVEQPNGRLKRKKVPVKERRMRELKAPLIDQYLKVQIMKAEIMRLDADKKGNDLLNEMLKALGDQATRTLGERDGSMKSRFEVTIEKDFAKLGEKGREMLQEAIRVQRKQIESSVVGDAAGKPAGS